MTYDYFVVHISSYDLTFFILVCQFIYKHWSLVRFWCRNLQNIYKANDNNLQICVSIKERLLWTTYESLTQHHALHDVAAIRWILNNSSGSLHTNCTGLFCHSERTWSRSISLQCCPSLKEFWSYCSVQHFVSIYYRDYTHFRWMCLLKSLHDTSLNLLWFCPAPCFPLCTARYEKKATRFTVI